MLVALVDYGAGNLTSVRKALAAVGATVLQPRTPDDLRAAAAIIVPGVGHFQATSALDQRWRQAILAAVAEGRPLLGICLGMQWLFDGSEEAPELPGLGVLAGRCRLLGGDLETNEACDTANEGNCAARLKVPHVGWNAIAFTGSVSQVLDGVANDAYVYFTHSYAPPVTEATTATTTHGRPFASVVQHNRICGVQFHPEKSGSVGLQILANFLTMTRS